MNLLFITQCVGSFIAWIGSVLTGNTGPNASWQRMAGFGCYLFANVLIGTWALCTGNWPLGLLYIAFLTTAARGLRNNLKDARESRCPCCGRLK